jgi:hypothetical protein
MEIGEKPCRKLLSTELRRFDGAKGLGSPQVWRTQRGRQPLRVWLTQGVRQLLDSLCHLLDFAMLVFPQCFIPTPIEYEFRDH